MIAVDSIAARRMDRVIAYLRQILAARNRFQDFDSAGSPDIPNSGILRSSKPREVACQRQRENRAEIRLGEFAEATVQTERRRKQPEYSSGTFLIQRRNVLAMLVALNPTAVFPLRE
jgi:hypothetical protein